MTSRHIMNISLKVTPALLITELFFLSSYLGPKVTSGLKRTFYLI